MKLSIIVPVYGVEKYILEFAQSLIFQLNNEVELIIINDGTKDRSITILKEYVTEKFLDRNIIWLDQENQGQSVARNYGISIAKGDYVTFLDPDDYVSVDYIYKIMSALGEEVDLVQFNARVFRNDISLKPIVLTDNSGIFYNNYNYIIDVYHKRIWFSWLRVFKRSFLTENFFPPGVNFQDMMAIPKVYESVKKIYNIDDFLVFYRVHSESSVHKAGVKLVKSAEIGLSLYGDLNKLERIIHLDFLKIYSESLVNSFDFLDQLKEIRKFLSKDLIGNKFLLLFLLLLLFNLKKIMKYFLRFFR